MGSNGNVSVTSATWGRQRLETRTDTPWCVPAMMSLAPTMCGNFSMNLDSSQWQWICAYMHIIYIKNMCLYMHVIKKE